MKETTMTKKRNLVENIAPPKGSITFFLFSLIIAVIVTLIWELYLKVNRLAKRLETLEQDSPDD